MQWLACLAHVEGALAAAEAGEAEGAASTLADVASSLGALHARASEHHSFLLQLLGAEASLPETRSRIEQELDLVYY